MGQGHGALDASFVLTKKDPESNPELFRDLPSPLALELPPPRCLSCLQLLSFLFLSWSSGLQLTAQPLHQLRPALRM